MAPGVAPPVRRFRAFSPVHGTLASSGLPAAPASDLRGRTRATCHSAVLPGTWQSQEIAYLERVFSRICRQEELRGAPPSPAGTGTPDPDFPWRLLPGIGTNWSRWRSRLDTACATMRPTRSWPIARHPLAGMRQFPGKTRVLQLDRGYSSGMARPQGHYRALTEQQEEWALQKGLTKSS